MSGWIKLHRAMVQWEWFTDVNTCHVFIYCLIRASHDDSEWRGKVVERGQFITSLPKMAKEVGLSEMQVRTAINKLTITGELTVKITNKYRVISITNYDLYQEDNRQSTNKPTGKQQTNNRQTNRQITGCESSNEPITDDSLAEDNRQNVEKLTADKNIRRKEDKNKKEKYKKEKIELPDWMPESEWQEFLQMRKEIKKPVTPTSAKRIITKLDDMRKTGNPPAKVLARSVENTWQGVFELPEAERVKVILPGQSIKDMPLYNEIMGVKREK